MTVGSIPALRIRSSVLRDVPHAFGRPRIRANLSQFSLLVVVDVFVGAMVVWSAAFWRPSPSVALTAAAGVLSSVRMKETLADTYRM
jgi:hypothetical protein